MVNIKHLVTIGSLFFLFLSTLIITSECPAKSNHIDWNDKSITWHEYNEGVTKSQVERKPIFLVVYANWCPTCQKMGNAFKNKDIIQLSSQFIMIRVDKDQNPDLSTNFGFDGEYVPRTFVIHPDGYVMHDLYPVRQHRYYLGVTPANLLLLMKKCLNSL